MRRFLHVHSQNGVGVPSHLENRATVNCGVVDPTGQIGEHKVKAGAGGNGVPCASLVWTLGLRHGPTVSGSNRRSLTRGDFPTCLTILPGAAPARPHNVRVSMTGAPPGAASRL